MHVLIFDNEDIIMAAIDIVLMSLLVTMTNSMTLIPIFIVNFERCNSSL